MDSANTDASVDNSQRDKNSSSASEHCVPKSEPSASSTTLPTSPASPTITPLVTSPQNEQSLFPAPVLTSSPPSTLQNTPLTNSTTNNLTTTTHKTQAAFVNKLYT
ncbi:16220_t:CDS:1, partial [Cetraspora pellucida]